MTTGTVLNISAKRLTTGSAMKIDPTGPIENAMVEFSADGLTEGRVLYVHSNSSDQFAERAVMVANLNPSAKAQTLRIHIASTSTGSYYRPSSALAIESSVSEPSSLEVVVILANWMVITLARDRADDPTSTPEPVQNGDEVGRINFDGFKTATG